MEIDIYKLIRESKCDKPGLFDDWVKKNKPDLKIDYSYISQAFWELSQQSNNTDLRTKKFIVIPDPSKPPTVLPQESDEDALKKIAEDEEIVWPKLDVKYTDERGIYEFRPYPPPPKKQDDTKGG